MESYILEFTCTGIENGGTFPIKNTGYGEDDSPEFVLHNLSDKAKTLAITLEDLSHPIKGFTHWLIWNIPAEIRIPEGIVAGKTVGKPKEAKQGIAYGFHRYAGPKPPKGKTHKFCFTIYVLDCSFDLGTNCLKHGFLKKARGHILQKGSLVAEFEGKKEGRKTHGI